jgi:hypothetical protein
MFWVRPQRMGGECGDRPACPAGPWFVGMGAIGFPARKGVGRRGFPAAHRGANLGEVRGHDASRIKRVGPMPGMQRPWERTR